MKKTHTLLLVLFLCLALIFPCALAEDAYVPGQRTQALIDAALDAGQIVGGETRLTLQLGDEILSMLADDEESQAQLDALMEVIGGVRLAGGFGKLEDGYRVELGGSYTAPSGDNGAHGSRPRSELVARWSPMPNPLCPLSSPCSCRAASPGATRSRCSETASTVVAETWPSRSRPRTTSALAGS